MVRRLQINNNRQLQIYHTGGSKIKVKS